ncbi:MAG: FAD-dependent oxidoreductase [Flavobacteriales bacterium]|nr:FAD-dependent oxidoreductase [Flavobacteriales bacterium]
MQKVDYIIVGQGLAGSVLSYFLLQENKSVLVIDEGKEDTSSRVAAGLCNPMVFKRLTKSWMIDEVFGQAKTFYQNQENLLGQDFYFDIPIYKLFVNEEEAEFWRQKSNEPELFEWIDRTVEFPFEKEHIDYPYGASKTLQSGFLQTEKWLNNYREFLIGKNAFLKERFDYNQIEFDNEAVNYKNIYASKIIFCEGYQSTKNKFFDWLPFKLTKGEVLTVRFKNLKLNDAINKGVFVLPYNNAYKLGATYNWDELNETTTKKGKEELLNKASRFISDEIEVINHKAGVRPTVNDRRPLLGVHPEFSQLAVFNGLGTKGVMLAPYFGQKMVSFLLENKSLPTEVNINRFNN